MNRIILVVLIIGFGLKGFGQHDHHHAPKPDTLGKPDHSMHSDSNAQSSMSHAFSLNLPMNRNGSGTGWLPDSSPMYGYMKHTSNWMLMMHGSLFLRYNNQDFTGKGTRGDKDFDAPNWFMLMGQRKVKQKGLFHFTLGGDIFNIFIFGRVDNIFPLYHGITHT